MANDTKERIKEYVSQIGSVKHYAQIDLQSP